MCGNVKVIIWLEYEGSVSISWYPNIDVLKHNSPIVWVSKPIPFPKKIVLFAKANTALGFLVNKKFSLGGVFNLL